MKNESSDPVVSSIVFQFLLGCMTLLYGLTRGVHLPPVFLIPYFLISGILYATGTIAFFRAYKEIEASEVMVLTGVGPISAIVGAYIFLHNRFSASQFFGVFLIISAVIVITKTTSAFRLNTGAWLAILGASCYGLANVCDAYIIRFYDAVSYLALICFLPGILILLRYIHKTPKIIRAMRHIDRNLIIFTALYAVQAIAFYIALSVGALVAQLNTISRASIVLTVILATLFLKERDRIPQKITAALITTIGVLLVSR